MCGYYYYCCTLDINIYKIENTIVYIQNSPHKNTVKHKKKLFHRLQRERYRLRVRASDRGEPPSYADVDVELDVVDRNNKPPIWDHNVYGPIFIRENVTVGTVVTSVKARLVFVTSDYYYYYYI